MSKEPDQQHAQYPPPQWDSQQSRGPYPPPPHQGGNYSGPPQPPYYQSPPAQPGDMVTLPPPPHQQQDLYRQHPSYDMYQGHPQQMPYPQNPHDPRDPQQGQVGFSQPAPRQRTAIACRYCRRRKIRCHGFNESPSGQCTNCSRFHQECIFTPVSSQAHAFVPAHTAYPHLRNTGRMPQTPDGRPLYPQQGGQPPMLYNAHGQPLGQIPPMPQHGQDPNYPPPHAAGYAPGPYPGPVYDDRGPPQPHAQDQAQAQPYYPPPSTARRTSPQSAYSYDARASGSPHGSTSSASGYAFPGGLHPPQVLPPARESGRTPPPGQGREGASNGTASRAGMSVRDMLGPGDGPGGRSSADSDMLKALSRRAM